ncbi:hypothetical protein PR048_014265 [Dryococelus australis]|uniref:PiggyBac transposable element-derived protein domain-containing protein n=1 Tax=Dryococelus australis TaxID=614101 RepID=A0ABQ9HDZ0_9NEOP|nr:hypothetical protein PR048_014265 [Dryococelus australis]
MIMVQTIFTFQTINKMGNKSLVIIQAFYANMIFMLRKELAQIQVKDWEKHFPNLFSFLLENGIGVCGTVRCNRKGLPAEMKHLKLKRGEESAFWHNQKEMRACSWQDTLDISIGFEKVEKPKLVSRYNKNVNGVNKFNQPCTNYTALVNGRIVYNKTNNKTDGAKHYVREPAAKRGCKVCDSMPLARLIERNFIVEKKKKIVFALYFQASAS